MCKYKTKYLAKARDSRKILSYFNYTSYVLLSFYTCSKNTVGLTLLLLKISFVLKID